MLKVCILKAKLSVETINIFTGHNFQRLSYFSRKSDIYPLQLISIEVGLGSELFTATEAQTWAQIYFEITNHGTTAQYITYSCIHSRAILLYKLSSFQ